ncbi:uracil-DNA glycosylase [Facklamia sp. 7083-14-GEN3]|uniref:uracil-DNA glycosylase n=1 Tax=Facklamia sp. 7083-14-GEN3 TaxID=2973478 RepID=UPI00215B8283|nr:uracil-DNA glycosylase [Facklamia sp. 7083-14-GEN3]MCR8968822.1 uracil-DNA glycosylase [Facklamia sp. 7083-14-GEN3]
MITKDRGVFMYQLPDLKEIAPDWSACLDSQNRSFDFQQLNNYLNKEKTVIYPPSEGVFKALELCPYLHTKVVIIGQDPYHGPNQANGLAFSVNEGQTIPPSLRNIFKELSDDLSVPIRKETDLSDWAKQGVLLLNRVLTVRAGQADSHQGIGWEIFTNQIIQCLNHHPNSLIYILWGKKAQSLEKLIDNSKHFVIKSSHPSPLAAYRGFFGSKPFSKTNSLLIEKGNQAIKWI